MNIGRRGLAADGRPARAAVALVERAGAIAGRSCGHRIVPAEVLITSTAGGIMPMTLVDGRPVGLGTPGPGPQSSHL